MAAAATPILIKINKLESTPKKYPHDLLLITQMV